MIGGEILFEKVKVVFKAQTENRWAIAKTTAFERREKLKKLHQAVLAHQQDFRDALYKDFRRPESEVDLTEIFLVTSEIKYTSKYLHSWLQPQRKSTPLSLFGTSARVMPEAKGVALIISPWNFPIHLSLVPLIHAIAAGCCVVLKPSEMTPHTSAVIKKLVESIFSENEVAVIEGDADTSTALLKLPFNHIFFTGAPAIGKIVMRAAAENLASVTLELGGKSPVIIDQTANIEAAARRIAVTKFTNCGQMCIAPDYVLIHESQSAAFIEAFKKQIHQYFGATAEAQKNGDFGHIVNQRHFKRIKSYFDDAILRGAKVASGGTFDEAENFIEPTILTHVPENSLVMQEEIFGPILPIVTFTNLSESIDYVNRKEKPLTFYIFSRDKKNIDLLLKNTSAGAVAINDAGVQYYNHNLPFGGVNNSGIGKAHGYYGFKEFTNEKAVLRQHLPKSVFEMLIYPPYTPRVKKIIDLIIKWF